MAGRKTRDAGRASRRQARLEARRAQRDRARARTAPGASARDWVLLAGVFLVAALFVYRRVLSGGFVSDDAVYLTPGYVRDPSAADLAAILDPWGMPARNTGNYAPLHLLAHALAFRLLGESLVAHHVLNVVLHTLCTTGLVALWVRAGIPFAGSALLGALFLLHPANVEAVAWISQLKSLLGMALACAVLLLEPRRPALAALAFVAALLTKFQTSFVLPVAALTLAIQRPAAPELRRRALWMGSWALALALVARPQLAAFAGIRPLNVMAPEGLAEQLLFGLALIGRYAVMAATSWGISAFHQPALPAGPADGFVLLGAAVAGAAAIRFAVVLVRRDMEAVFWLWAAAALGPVAQALPFVFPMADRYLYFMLPGLLGALGLALRAPLARVLAERRLRPALALPALAILLVFAVRSDGRAVLFRSNQALDRDSAANYPDGLIAHRLRAVEAAQRGNVDEVVAELRAARDRGFDRFELLERDRRFEAFRSDPRFRAVIAEVADAWLANVAGSLQRTPTELVLLGRAHRARGDWQRALAAFAAASDEPGRIGALARAEMEETRARRARESERAGGG